LHCTSCMQVIHLHANSCKHENVLKTENLYDSYSKTIFYQNSKYEVHQVCPKYSRSQNFSLLAFEGEAVSVTQIWVQRRVTDGKFFFAQNMFFTSSLRILKFRFLKEATLERFFEVLLFGPQGPVFMAWKLFYCVKKVNFS
jgi:hypothetical protein